MNYSEESLKKHIEWKGKIEIKSRVSINSKDDLSLAYTPGVASPCLEIKNNEELSYLYTRKQNTIAVITDGSAVLGLGDIGPSAGMPVMEGKCILFKTFADVDAMPILVNTKDVDEFVNTVYLISKSFGGINLEDISAPRCFEIEKQLIDKCDIPIFHDDQHGTAIVVLAGLINALKITNKNKEDIKIVISGAGAAGVAICKLLLAYGCKNILILNHRGVISRNKKENKYDFNKKLVDTNENYFIYNNKKINFILDEIANITNTENVEGSLDEAIVDADVFIGVSAPNILTFDMIKKMKKDPIIFACANPTPEVDPNVAKDAGAKIIATGRSDLPNQLNNLLVFPGIFRGLLDNKYKKCTMNMKLKAANALANYVKNEDLSVDYIIPNPLDKNVANNIAKSIVEG